MKKIFNSFLCRGAIMVFFLVLTGCSVDSITAPNGSTIEVIPSSLSLTGLSGDTPYNFYAVVKDENSLPLNSVKVHISGSFASPRSPARYYFYTDMNGGGTQVNSGFDCITNEFGQCSFSIIIPATVNNSENVFTDDIVLNSGSASVTVEIALTAASS